MARRNMPRGAGKTPREIFRRGPRPISHYHAFISGEGLPNAEGRQEGEVSESSVRRTRGALH